MTWYTLLRSRRVAFSDWQLSISMADAIDSARSKQFESLYCSAILVHSFRACTNIGFGCAERAGNRTYLLCKQRVVEGIVQHREAEKRILVLRRRPAEQSAAIKETV